MANGEIGVAGGPAVPGEKRSCVRSRGGAMGYCPTLPAQRSKLGRQPNNPRNPQRHPA